jgi:hypothetical protein
MVGVCARTPSQYARNALEVLSFPARVFRLSTETSPFNFVDLVWQVFLAFPVGVAFVFFVIAARNYLRTNIDVR